MQFAKIATLFAIAAGASATVLPRNDGGVSLCAEPPSGKCSVKTESDCDAVGGTSYTCVTGGLINILTCSPINVADGVTVVATVVDLLDVLLGKVTLDLL